VKGSLLSKDATHYLVPMVDVAKHFFDILEFKDLTGILFLQTVVNAVQVAKHVFFVERSSTIESPLQI
jgi:hypothetical protein